MEKISSAAFTDTKPEKERRRVKQHILANENGGWK